MQVTIFSHTATYGLSIGAEIDDLQRPWMTLIWVILPNTVSLCLWTNYVKFV